MDLQHVINGIDQARLIRLVQDLVDAPSPNPPGDISAPARVAIDFLLEHNIPYEVREHTAGMINLVATVTGEKQGTHLVMNAHLDVFPANAVQVDEVPPGSAGAAAAVYGRGAVDMKAGAAAFLVVLRSLHEVRAELCGKATLLLVCDEETFGPDGSRALLEHDPTLLGDVMLSAEPSSTDVIRYGERGHIWAHLDFLGQSGHSAYPSRQVAPIERAARCMAALRQLVPEPVGFEELTLEEALAPSGESLVDHLSLNFGTVQGGTKVNMKPTACTLGVDIRIPLHLDLEPILSSFLEIARRHDAEVTLLSTGEPNASDPNHKLFNVLAAAVREETSRAPNLAIGLGCTDARLWRFRAIPAAVFGPDPSTMARDDEHVRHDELRIISRVHLRTALELLTEPGARVHTE